jgi:hypothetical protein
MPQGTIGGVVTDELGAGANTTLDFHTGCLSINENGQIVLQKNKRVTYSNGTMALLTWPTNYLLSFQANPRYTLHVLASGKDAWLNDKTINNSGTTVTVGSL